MYNLESYTVKYVSARIDILGCRAKLKIVWSVPISVQSQDGNGRVHSTHRKVQSCVLACHQNRERCDSTVIRQVTPNESSQNRHGLFQRIAVYKPN